MDDSREMFCSSCGERIRSSANFCRHCGEPNRYGDRTGWGPPPDRDSERESATEWGREGRPDDRGGASEWGDGARGHERADRARPRSEWEGDRREPPAGGVDGVPADDVDSVPWRAYLPASAWRPDEPTWRVVGGAVGIGLLGFLVLVIVTVLVAGIGFAAGLSLPLVLLGGTVVGQYLGFFGLSLWYLRHRGLDWDRIKGYLGIRRPTLKELGLILGAWLVLIAGAIAISVLAQIVAELLGAGEPGEAEQDITEILAANPEYVPIAILVMFLVVGPCEEILFRGVVQGRLREHLSAAPAIAIASVFFAVLHVGGLGGSAEGILIAISVLTVAGLVLGALYEYTQNLVVVSLLHGFHNSMIVLFVYIDAVYDLEEGVLAPLVVALPV